MTIWTPKILSDGQNKFESIANAIEEGVRDGNLKPGDKLPTQRKLAQLLSVTIGTVGRAYELAQKRGLISLEVGRGSFVRTFMNQASETQSDQGVIDLGLNVPPQTEHHEFFSRALSQISNSPEVARLFGNAPIESFHSHRMAAAKWLQSRVECEAEEIVICSGAQNAIVSILTTLTKPGDSILVEELTFPGMIAAARVLNLKLHPLKMDSQGIIPLELERGCEHSKTLYCIPTNHNPTTVTMPLSRREAIADISKKRGIQIIEDDVYGVLVDSAPVPIGKLAPENTFLMTSLAKSLSIGLRLAFVKVPSKFRKLLLANMRATNFFPAPLLCEIAANWINDGTANKMLKEQRKIAARRQQIAKEILGGKYPAETPNGNHIWLKLPESWTSQALERAATENGVGVYPENAFTTQSDTHWNSVRIALGAARSEHDLRVGLQVIERLLTAQSEQNTAKY